MYKDSSAIAAITSEMYGAVVRIARGVDRGDRSLILSGYHPGAVDDHGLFKGSAEAFADWVLSSTESVTFMQHGIESFHVLALTEREAASESYYLVRTTGSDGNVGMAFGRYLDHFEERSGRWLITSRLTTLEHTTSNLGYPEEGYERGRRDALDPSYSLAQRVLRAGTSQSASQGRQ